MRIFICVGCGIHSDGTTSEMNKEMVKTAWVQSVADEDAVIFQGGYKNPEGSSTEAESMLVFAKSNYPFSDLNIIVEKVSYYTHNNAWEGLKLASNIAPEGGEILLIDHPWHVKRTFLCYQTVNRLYYGSRYTIKKVPVRCVWDPNIPGQEYWATPDSFLSREMGKMLQTRILFFRPWARLGFRFLRKIWPSNKQ